MFLRERLVTKIITLILIIVTLLTAIGFVGGQMANILVKLDLMGETVEGEILSKSSNISTNNVSKPLTEPTERNYGFNGICVDEWKVGDDGSLNTFSGYNGLMFKPTDENGELATDLVFTVVGSNITNVTFYFDETAKQWATEAYIDGEKMVSDDHIWTFAWDTPVIAKTITFTKWHRPNYNACITHLDIILDELIFGDKWIENFDSLSQSVADNTVPNYCVLANTGDLTLNDVNGELKDYAEDGILDNSNYPLMIFANGKQIQYHISKDTEYDFDAKQIKIDLSNNLSKIGEYDSYFYGARIGKYYIDQGTHRIISLYDILAKVMGYGIDEQGLEIYGNDISAEYPIFDEMLDSQIIYKYNDVVWTTTVKGYLSNIEIPFVYLEKSNLKNVINNICQVAQLNLIEKDNGDLKFVGARPIITTTQKDNAIIIPLSTQTSSFYPNIISKNKYDNIKIEKNYPLTKIDNFVNINYIGYENINKVFYNSIITNFDLDVSLDSYSNIRNFSFVEFTQEFKIPDNLVTQHSYNSTEKDSDLSSIFYYLLKYSKINYNYYNGNLVSQTGIEGNESITLNSVTEDSDEETFITDDYPFSPLLDNINILTMVNSKAEFENMKYYEGTQGGFDFVVDYKNVIAIDKTLSTKDNLVVYFHLNYKTIYNNTYKLLKSASILLKNNFLDSNTEIVSKGEGDNILNLESNFLVQENAIFDKWNTNKKVYNLLLDNIFDDYKDGIINAELSVICGDYYDKDGNKVITWQNGEVLQVGDIVRVDKDNEGTTASRYKDGSPRYFRITSRNFRYDGVPLIDLELMEVKAIS